MIFIDACIFIALGNENDVHYERAIQILKEIESKKYGPPCTSDYVFNEIIGVTRRKKSKEESISLGEHVRDSTFIITTSNTLLESAWDFFKESEHQFSLVDCTIIKTLEYGKIEFLATFDKEFLKLRTIKVVS